MRQAAPWWHALRSSDLGITLALVAACLLVFGRILTHGFIHYDDDLYVVLNPMVKQGLRRDSVAWAFTTFAQNHWHPLTWLSHMLDVQLFGLAAAGHHATSLVLHVINTILVFAFFRTTTGARWPSALVAGLFALHPTHVESVAWIADRKDLLAALFGLLSVLLYSRYAATLRWRWLTASLVVLALGFMSKSSVIVWPALYLVIDLWPLRRIRELAGSDANDSPAPARPVSWRRALVEKVGIAVPSLVFAAIGIFANIRGDLASLHRALPTWKSLAAAADALLFYVGKTLWPVPLALPYPGVASVHTWRALLGCGLVIVVTAIGVRLRRRAPWLLGGWLWYLITLLPMSGIVLIGTELRADRYTYLTTIGLYAIVVGAAASRSR